MAWFDLERYFGAVAAEVISERPARCAQQHPIAFLRRPQAVGFYQVRLGAGVGGAFVRDGLRGRGSEQKGA